jgi:hypothetical protein
LKKQRQADRDHRINVNDPGLITLVNKLQDVFTTVGVSGFQCCRKDVWIVNMADSMIHIGSKPHRSASNRRSGFAVEREVISVGEHCWERLVRRLNAS